MAAETRENNQAYPLALVKGRKALLDAGIVDAQGLIERSLYTDATSMKQVVHGFCPYVTLAPFPAFWT